MTNIEVRKSRPRPLPTRPPGKIVDCDHPPEEFAGRPAAVPEQPVVGLICRPMAGRSRHGLCSPAIPTPKMTGRSPPRAATPGPPGRRPPPGSDLDFQWPRGSISIIYGHRVRGS